MHTFCYTVKLKNKFYALACLADALYSTNSTNNGRKWLKKLTHKTIKKYGYVPALQIPEPRMYVNKSNGSIRNERE